LKGLALRRAKLKSAKL